MERKDDIAAAAHLDAIEREDVLAVSISPHNAWTDHSMRRRPRHARNMPIDDVSPLELGSPLVNADVALEQLLARRRSRGLVAVQRAGRKYGRVRQRPACHGALGPSLG